MCCEKYRVGCQLLASGLIRQVPVERDATENVAGFLGRKINKTFFISGHLKFLLGYICKVFVLFMKPLLEFRQLYVVPFFMNRSLSLCLK